MLAVGRGNFCGLMRTVRTGLEGDPRRPPERKKAPAPDQSRSRTGACAEKDMTPGICGVRSRGELPVPRGAKSGREGPAPPWGAPDLRVCIRPPGVLGGPPGAPPCMGMHSGGASMHAPHHSMAVPGSIVLGCGTVRLRPLPLRWLHHRQITVTLSSVSVPPLL